MSLDFVLLCFNLREHLGFWGESDMQAMEIVKIHNDDLEFENKI